MQRQVSVKSPNLASIEEDFFKGKNPLGKILTIALDLMGARHTGLLYGTNATQMRFLPSSEWDRGGDGSVRRSGAFRVGS